MQRIVLVKEVSVNPVFDSHVEQPSIMAASRASTGLGREGIATVEFLNVRVLSYQPILPETLAEIEDTMNHRNCDKNVTVSA
jgi:hypothetical protein